MALAAGLGITIEMGHGFDPAAAQLFGEDQGRYLLATRDGAALIEAAEAAGVSLLYLGHVVGDSVQGDRDDPRFHVTLDALRAAHEDFFPRLMAPSRRLPDGR
jgi:phosphoribosylformylglycinamidine synthase